MSFKIPKTWIKLTNKEVDDLSSNSILELSLDVLDLWDFYKTPLNKMVCIGDKEDPGIYALLNITKNGIFEYSEEYKSIKDFRENYPDYFKNSINCSVCGRN